MNVIGGGAVTVNVTPALACPPAVTTTGPVVAPAGTVTPMLVAVQLVVAAAVPLNVTVPAAPKFVPAIVTAVPMGPLFGVRLVITGAGGADTVNVTPALACPPTVTTTGPVVAPAGTVTPMLVAVQLVVAAAVPLNVTVPDAPKFVPAIVTGVSTGPLFGVRLVITGAGTPPLAR